MISKEIGLEAPSGKHFSGWRHDDRQEQMKS